MIAVTLANPNENSAIEKTTIKGLRSPTTSQLTPRDSFWNPFKDKSKNAPLNVPMRSPLEFPHLLLLTSKMTTRGNLYPCLPPPSIPLLLAKKKKKINFRLDFVQAIESISQCRLFCHYYLSALDRKKKGKKTNSWSSIKKNAFCRISVIEWKLNHWTRW